VPQPHTRAPPQELCPKSQAARSSAKIATQRSRARLTTYRRPIASHIAADSPPISACRPRPCRGEPATREQRTGSVSQRGSKQRYSSKGVREAWAGVVGGWWRQLPAHSAPGCYVSAAQTREDRRSSDHNRAQGAPIPPSTVPTHLSVAPRPTCVPETAHPAASVRSIACRPGHYPLGASAAHRSSPAGGQKGKARRGRWRQQTPESHHDPPLKSPIYLRYLAGSASDRGRRGGGRRTYRAPPRRRASKSLGSP
jgi:hypothetical protein